MSKNIIKEDLTISSLICSRVCHDLINPVGAIINGLEVMETEDAKEMKSFALNMIKKSAEQASSKLQVARIAWGSFSNAGAMLDLDYVNKIAQLHLSHERPELDWQLQNTPIEKIKAQLLINIIIIASHSIPRGGTITATSSSYDSIMLTCKGRGARVPEETELITNTNPIDYDHLTARNINYHVTRILLNASNSELLSKIENDETIVFTVKLGKL